MNRSTPLYDSSLSDRERAEYLLSQLTTEEKYSWFTLRIRNDRLGLKVSTCGGEGAHGVQARAGQGEAYPPTPTTSFTQPIGMAASFDPDCRICPYDIPTDRGTGSVDQVFRGETLPGFGGCPYLTDIACEQQHREHFPAVTF